MVASSSSGDLAMNRRMIYSTFLLIAFLSASWIPVLGQATQGSISGRITDASGGVMAGVSVTLTNEGTAEQRKTTSSSAGYYVFPDLFPGTYTVKAEFSGFATATATGLVLQVEQQVTHDVEMQVGQAKTNIEVKASAPVLDTRTGSTGQVITNTQVLNLPLNGRNFLSLSLLVSGASENPGAQSQFSINGQRGNQTSMLFGGGDVRLIQNGRPAFVPSVDAVREFKIQQNSFSAVYGYGTAIINAAFRSGTNEFHGGIWEFLRNDVLDARSFFDSKVPPLRRNQFGFTVGGPIRKNRTFFFVGFEALRNRRGGTGFALVPTPAELSGDFTGAPPIFDPPTLDPGTGRRQQFPNNTIPSGRVSQFAKAAAKLYPKPNLVGVEGFNFTKALNNKEDSNQLNLKIDHKLSEKDSFFIRASRSRDLSVTDHPLPLSGENASNNAFQVVLHESHTFSSNLLSSLDLGYTYGLSVLGVPLADRPIAAQDFGLKNLKIPSFSQGMPLLDIVGISTMGTSPFRPFGGKENNYQLQGNVTYIRGGNQLQFGAEVRQYRPVLFDQATPNGILSFDSRFTRQPGIQGTGDPVADFVLGFPFSARATQLVASNGQVSLRWSLWSSYAQEGWKITPKLTLNAGLRFEHQTSPFERFNTAFVWSTAQNRFLVPGKDIDDLINPTSDFAPRVGLAYRLTSRTVVRVGFGVFYGFLRGNELSSGYHLDPPFNVDSTLNSDPLVPTLPGVLWPPAPTTVAPGTNIFSIDHNLFPNYNYEWNFNLQRELVPNLVFQIAYVGSSSHGLTGRDLVNQARPDPIGANPTPVQGRRAFPGAADISITKSVDNANYNALQATLEKRYSSGLSLLAAYTYSKALGISEAGDQSAIGDEFSPRKRYYGPLPYDQTQRFTVSYTYELPFGERMRFGGSVKGPVGRLISGWQTTGIGTFFTGEPRTPSSNVSPNVGRIDRNPPNRIRNGNLPDSQRTLDRYIDTGAFVGQPFGTFGNSGSGILHTANFGVWDMGLLKNTSYRERCRLEFRAEFFNLFNIPNFGFPGLTAGSKSFGVIRSTRGNAREIQFALKFYW